MSAGALSGAGVNSARTTVGGAGEARLAAALGLALVALTLLTYRGALANGFVFDDAGFVTENPMVVAGPTAKGIAWAFTTFHGGNWQPLTWISHMLDARLFGLRPAGHHATSLLLHVANSLLLFVVLRRMTGAIWRSALVAALFAVHPLHVESVAWVAERKDVLSTFFMLLALEAYRRHARRPGAARYLAVAGWFVLGLLSKPMLVSLPLLLLLLDWWPLQRGAVRGGGGGGTPWRILLLEKMPLLGIAAIVGAVTIAAQRQTGTLGTLPQFPLGTRLENAVVSYALYLLDLIWPSRLACLYPYVPDLPAWKVGGAALLLAGVTLAVCTRGHLAAGWLWYLVALLPVIGLVQVGVQSHADRYTYIPSIGFFIMVVWALPARARGPQDDAGLSIRTLSDSSSRSALLEKVWRPSRRATIPRSSRSDLAARLARTPARAAATARLAGALALAAVAALAVATAVQTGYWKDDVTLFGRAVAVTEENSLAHYNLGTALEKRGRFPEALRHLSEAARISPDYAHVRNNIGHVLSRQGDHAGAAREFAAVLAVTPLDALAHFNLGFALIQLGRGAEAGPHLLAALEIDPGLPQAHYSLGNLRYGEGKLEEAAERYRAALRTGRAFPLAPDAHNNLGIILSAQGRPDEAVARFEEALRLKPDFTAARDNLALARRERASARPRERRP
ncbi:MAG TPA: tetratricopeptide repeat protein [Candidatus Methanoperedens sp.]|nr:tetratricopeptide repeat protein [Candidatus Methanoperedens sp.]